MKEKLDINKVNELLENRGDISGYLANFEVIEVYDFLHLNIISSITLLRIVVDCFEKKEDKLSMIKMSKEHISMIYEKITNSIN